MRKPTLIRPHAVELRKAVFELPRPINDVYLLIHDGVEDGRHLLPLTHVSAPLQPYFLRGEVAAFDVHRLVQNGTAMRVLPAQPVHLVTAIETTGGQRIVSIPSQLLEARSRYLCFAGVTGGLAVVSALAGLPWLALVGIPAAMALRAALQVPIRQHEALQPEAGQP